MRTNIVSGLFVLMVLVELNSGCEMWCRKPMSFEYICCDKGNPYLASAATTAGPSHTLPTRKGCRYYCAYADKVYCCDDASEPAPENHDTHEGRCATKKEQVCKKGGIYLHIHAAKMTTKDGGRILSKKGKDDHHKTCASDGYCADHEKCCENRCAKKHTCMHAVYDYDGARRTISKKKNTRRN